jgi:hypothetical protein
MSYGKEDAHTNRITASMSQQMGNARRFHTGGKQGAPAWANRYYPTKVGSDTIRLVPGKYEIQRLLENDQVITEVVPWYECTEHYYASIKQGIVCSGGVFRDHKTKKEPCEGCEMFWADWQERNDIKQRTGQKVTNPNRVSKSNRFIFHVLDMGYWFKGPDFDDNGLPRKDDKGNQYTKWIKYNQANPQHGYLLSQVTDEKDKRWGRLLDWNMGRDHFGVLTKYADYTGANCASCGGIDCLQVQRWYCPGCHADMFDPQQLMLPAQALQELTSRPSVCRGCRGLYYPAEHLRCVNCPNGVRASIFDVDLTLMAQEDPQNKGTQLCFLNVSAPKGIPDHFQDLLQKLPDLKVKYAPTSLADQRTKFQRAKPGGQPPAAGAAHALPPPAPPGGAYGGNPAPVPTVAAVPNYAAPYAAPAPLPYQAPVHHQAPMAVPPAVPPAGGGWGSK